MAKYNFNSDSEAKSYMKSIVNSPEFQQFCKASIKSIKQANYSSKSSSKWLCILDLSLSKALFHGIIVMLVYWYQLNENWLTNY